MDGLRNGNIISVILMTGVWLVFLTARYFRRLLSICRGSAFLPDYGSPLLYTARSSKQGTCFSFLFTVAELMDGEESEERSVRLYDDEQIMDLLRRTQELEKQKNQLYGILLIVMGIALQALSHTMGGSDMQELFSGILLGLSVGEMLVGVYILGRSMIGR